MKEMLEIISNKLEVNTIHNKRNQIKKSFIHYKDYPENEKITMLTHEDLQFMFNLYDSVFFNHWFRELYGQLVKFSLSKRMTRSAGQTICSRNIGIKAEKTPIEIRIGSNFFYNYDSVEGKKMVSGIETKSSIEALQLVFEHEICHVVEFILYKKSSCSGKRFKAIAYNLFGHTDRFHRLPTNAQIAKEKYDLNLGDKVFFEYENKTLSGILYKIHKRAVVLVKDKKGHLMDRQGIRYTKFYVPLSRIEKN